MRPVTRMFLILACLPGIISSLGAVTVTIGSGTASNQYLPIRAERDYTFSQQIYTQAQINTVGVIERLSFYKATSGTLANSNNWTIYLGYTSKASFASTTDWVPAPVLTQVFSGTVSIPTGTGWMQIILQNPFPYNNEDNLVIAVDENATGNGGSAWSWRSFTSGTNTGM